jgi:leucyl-tRNA synthetase
MSERYDHRAVEARWQTRWEADGLHRVDVDRVDPAARFYNLVEFPYPSAEGLHVGHAYTYCGADTFGRYQRMRGRTVFQPMGFDSFGIHTENYALRVGENPRTLTERTVVGYRRQLRRLGAAWDWSREVVTSDPRYYRWTQWIFLQLYRAGLAVRREAPVVWCPSCLTVLAYEQVEGDRCERCGTEVTERVMRQWFLRITEFADRLLDGLDHLDWPEFSKRGQREWIGRSRGVEVDFVIRETGEVVSTFTTRPDTLYGVTFLAVPPGSPLSGAHAIHPATGETVPVHEAEYVVAEYGTGAVMGVPAHDQRDWEFALVHGLPVTTVIEGPEPPDGCWTGEGRLVDSGLFTGLSSEAARDAIAGWLEEQGSGHRVTRYRMHDWLISRQRFWGPPIPIVYCDACGELPVPEADLPVLLPDVEEFRPTGTGASPLASVESFVRTTCPSCGGEASRETDVSDTFLDSAWYFLRYPSSDIDDEPWDSGRTARMLPVDQYAGGKEHVVRHHLYARFVTMAMHDLGHLPFEEPFPRLRLHGLLLKDGAKMSKSRGNVVNPDEYVERVGADVLRMYLLFCGPWEDGGDFSDEGLAGIERFLLRIRRLLSEPPASAPGGVDVRPLDRAVAAVQADLERLKFNTSISSLMELVRWAREQRPRFAAEEWDRVVRTIVLLLAPFAPHLAEELWERLGGPYSVHAQPWPAFDEAALVEEEITLVIQVDGRVRDRVTAPVGLDEDEALSLALASENVRRHLDGTGPSTVVFLPDRLINLVSGGRG